ncbi:MAG: FAD-binding oxidoreductase [Candidatus Bathyarchaeia archaeon]
MTEKLEITGEVLSDEATLKAYSFDMSHYAVKPQMVAVPANEDDIAKLIAFAKQESIPITPRGAGSNQSGSAVGSGIIVLFSKMNATVKKDGRKVQVQAGVIHQALDLYLAADGLRIPYDPTSRSFCTIGGNVATKASGLRSLKYGTVDSALRSLRFFDAAHGLIDTSGCLPQNVEEAVLELKKRLISDKEAIGILNVRGNLKSSSGYNLCSLIQHEEPSEIVTHLLAGSVGTLGVFSEIELEAVPIPESRKLYIVFFHSLQEAAEEVGKLVNFKPSAIELMDAYGVDLLKATNKVKVSPDCKAVLFVEFDSDLDQASIQMASYLKGKSIKFSVENNPKKQDELWKIRESMLLWIMNSLETPQKRFPPFADDIAVPLGQLPNFVAAVQQILASFGTIAVIYGHAGEGNLHIRPMINIENWEESLRNLSSLIFNAALKAGGTITAEHGLGRNRSLYLLNEWGEKIYRYFMEVKKIFDPVGILNPGVVFTSDDLTRNLKL